jgi:hypothetical protein
MIALEHAAQMVAKLRQVDQNDAMELFFHFDDVFKLSDMYRPDDNGKYIIMFADLCGYGIATNVKIA